MKTQKYGEFVRLHDILICGFLICFIGPRGPQIILLVPKTPPIVIRRFHFRKTPFILHLPLFTAVIQDTSSR